MSENQFNTSNSALNQETSNNFEDKNSAPETSFEAEKIPFNYKPAVDIRPNLKRAQIAQYFLLAVMVTEILSIGSSYLQLVLLDGVANGEEITDMMIDSNDTREQWMGITYTIFFILSAITFIQWFRRAYYNLSIRTETTHSEGWAAGSWFVPFINLIRPYRIMMELSSKTTQLINIKTNEFTTNNATLIGVWWTLWIIGTIAEKVLIRAVRDADTIEGLQYMTHLNIILSTFMVPLSIIAIYVIKTYSQKEERLNELENNPQTFTQPLMI